MRNVLCVVLMILCVNGSMRVLANEPSVDELRAGDVLTLTDVYVVDGDSLTIRLNGREHRVRLQGIDAPESQQAMGDAARERLARWLTQREVTIKVSNQDRYQRWLARVFVGERDINLAMVQAGFAWCYMNRAQQDSVYSQRCDELEHAASVAKLGLWVDDQPIKPSIWRRNKRNERALEQQRMDDGVDAFLDRVQALYQLMKHWLLGLLNA